MTKTLPARPDLEWLKKSAKERLAELRAEDPATKLHQAQLAVARDYGFASWRALKVHVDGISLDGQIIAAASEAARTILPGCSTAIRPSLRSPAANGTGHCCT